MHLSNSKYEQKNSGLNRDFNPDLCDSGAELLILVDQSWQLQGAGRYVGEFFQVFFFFLGRLTSPVLDSHYSD